MLLKFIGTGSAFNTELGNNSAYYKAGSSLLLFDCGCDVFSRLKEKDENGVSILDGVLEISVLITHLKQDHMGSLGTLIEYSYHILGIRIKVIYPNAVELSDSMFRVGVRPDLYTFVHCRANDHSGLVINHMAIIVQPVKTNEYAGVVSYGYIVFIDGTQIYYSGDSRIIPALPLNLLNEGEIEEFYQDISGRPINPEEYWSHLKYGDLIQLIPVGFRSRVFLMHQDEAFTLVSSMAVIDGFGVV